jgi:hypothetical protein
MRYRLRTLLLLSAAIPPVLAVARHYMPAIRLSTNCGGNNAARTYVHAAAITMIMAADESSERQFAIASATPEELNVLASSTVGWGVREGDILISTKPLRLNENGGHQVVAVCNRPFTNVPQYMFRRAAASHAVAFSDGSTALLSAREYAALDLESFVPLHDLVSLP